MQMQPHSVLAYVQLIAFDTYFCSFVVEDCNPYSELWTTRIQLLLRVMCGLPVSMTLITSVVTTTVTYAHMLHTILYVCITHISVLITVPHIV